MNKEDKNKNIKLLDDLIKYAMEQEDNELYDLFIGFKNKNYNKEEETKDDDTIESFIESCDLDNKTKINNAYMIIETADGKVQSHVLACNDKEKRTEFLELILSTLIDSIYR